MRAETKKKHEMGKRFAILIGLAAAGVMALGAQTASAATYNTKLTITGTRFPRPPLIHGRVFQAAGRSARLGDG